MPDNVRKVVYIEDDNEMIDLVKLMLTPRHFEVLGASGGLEGLDLVRKIFPDIILLDLMMPDLDGWDVFKQLKGDESTKSIPVIVITAKAESIDRVLGLHIAKVEDYLYKPFSSKELVDSIERVLKGK